MFNLLKCKNWSDYVLKRCKYDVLIFTCFALYTVCIRKYINTAMAKGGGPDKETPTICCSTGRVVPIANVFEIHKSCQVSSFELA